MDNMLVKEIKNYDEIIFNCYHADKDILKYFRKGFTSVDDAINKTIDLLKQGHKLKFFIIKEYGQLVGYFALEDTKPIMLTTYFLDVSFRKQPYYKSFWNTIENFLNEPFLAAAYSENSRAIRFLEKNKGKFISSIEHENNLFNLYRFEGK